MVKGRKTVEGKHCILMNRICLQIQCTDISTLEPMQDVSADIIIIANFHTEAWQSKDS